MRLPETLRNRLRGPATRLRGWRGHLDGVIGGALVGWVQVRTAPQGAQVGLYAGGALLAQAPANVYRGDLAAMGMGDGHAGFVLPLSPEITGMIAAAGGEAEVRVIGPRPHLLGRWRPEPGAQPAALPAPGTGALQKRLWGDLQRLARRLDAAPAAPQDLRPATPAQARLFGGRDYLNGGTLPEPVFAYAEFLRHRNRLDDRFDPAANPDDIAHFLKHYLGVYGATRGGLRIPLSAAAIDWLNAPVVIGGQRNTLSRAAWAFLMDAPALRQQMDFADPGWYLSALYWWAVHQARAIHCEDCLVPQAWARRLAAVPGGRAGGAWAPSEFMLRMQAGTPELAALPASIAGLRDLTCALMVMALTRPDFLRYLPAEAREAALAGPAGETPLATFCARMGQPLPGLDRAGYAHALRQAGFDLETLRFTTFTAEGHRAESARLGPPAGEPVEVQVIGPFRKASGLGQATRLSAELLERAGFAVHRVDFGLDNPAPEEAAEAAAAGCRPARVNLFHLNAETVPLATAYLPDVFTGAYNIAYVFWELDSPGACHSLGLDLVDEIWVAPEFGVSVFQPWTDKPVTNVGMSFEALPEIAHAPARALLERRTGAGTGDFVFLVTFDSFSFLMRKNALGVIAAFARAFPDEPGVRLVLKTQNRAKVADPAQRAIWGRVDAAVRADPRIVLIDETLPYEEILQLKKGADAYLSLHRSEGWGFGMIEAMNLGTPVIATAYSGNMDFCDDKTCWLVDYTLTEVGPHDYIFVRPGQKWAEPDIEDAARQMRAVFDNPADRATRAAAALDRVRRDFSAQAIAARYGARMRTILAGLDGGPEDRSENRPENEPENGPETGPVPARSARA